MSLKWLTNTYDPSKPDADLVIRMYDETQEDAVKEHNLSNKIIGRPKQTDKYTVEQLESMGMVGVYSKGDDENNK